MKSNLFLAALAVLGSFFFCGVGFGDALDSWHWSNPLPTGNSFFGVTFGAGYFVAVGNGGAVVTSTNAVNWASAASPTSGNLDAVTYGGGLYAAVGSNGVIQVSADATNWTADVSGTTANFAAVTYGDGVFVAVGAGGTIITSTDGVSWTPRASTVQSKITGVAWGNGTFVAVCPQAVLLSSDGVNWTSHALNGVGIGPIIFASGLFVVEGTQYVRYSQFQSLYRGFAYSSSDGVNWSTPYTFSYENSAIPYAYPFITYGNGVYFDGSHFSTDGLTWTDAALTGYVAGYQTGYAHGNTAAYGNGTFVVLDNAGAIYSSTNGTAWTSPTVGLNSILTSVAFGNGTYVAVGENYVLPPNTYPNIPFTNVVLCSTNGSAYQPVTFTNGPLSAVVWTNGTFTAVGPAGLIVQSQTGLTWTQRNSGTVNELYAVTAGDGQLVTVGDKGTIQTSSAGLAWTGRFSGTSEPLYSIVYGDGMFVAVGYQGTILTSSDGNSWSAQYSGISSALYSVTYGSAGFAAGGTGGVIVTSTDGVNWTVQNSGATQITSLSYGDGYYVAVGASATAANVTLTSLDGVTWTPRRTIASPNTTLYGVAFVTNHFELVGAVGVNANLLEVGNGAIIESGNVATMPLSLQIQPSTNGLGLTIFAPVGSSFHVQSSASLALPAWANVAAFSNVLAATPWTDPGTNGSQKFYRAVAP